MGTLSNLTFFSAFSFLFFGVACLVSAQMKAEFVRYGLAKYRRMVGSLQLLGVLGLVLGYFFSPMLQASAAAGLSILMISGFTVRLRIRDNFLQSVPSFIYAVLNAYLFILLVDSLL